MIRIEAMMDEMPMTVEEAAKYYKLTTKTILKLVKKGELPGVKLGSRWRVFRLKSVTSNEAK